MNTCKKVRKSKPKSPLYIKGSTLSLGKCMKYPFISTKMAIIQRSKNNQRWWKCEEIRTLIHYWWEYKTVWQLCQTARQVLKMLVIMRLNNSTPRSISKRIFKISKKSFKKANNPNVHHQLIKETKSDIHIMECNLAIKRNQILIDTYNNMDDLKID